METLHGKILTINAGSSSVKYAVFSNGGTLERVATGSIEAFASAAEIMERIGLLVSSNELMAIGHRIVSGGPRYYAATIIDDVMMNELRSLVLFDPEHLPEEIRLAEEFRMLFPSVPHVALFDTAFHADLPRVAQLLAIPRHYETLGVRRYGFHGISYASIMQQLARTQGELIAQGRIVIAHLGSGASLAAVRGGKPLDTTMGFTPTSGIPMSTRSGDLDPGIAWYLAQKENMTSREFNEMITRRSGLLGVSELSGDMKQLLESETTDIRAAEAVSLFCYQVKKYIGAYAAVMGGLDALVFTGGMGEEAPKIRARVCEDLGFLGVEIDAEKNNAQASLISKEPQDTQEIPGRAHSVPVFVMHTDEEAIIAEEVSRIIKIS